MQKNLHVPKKSSTFAAVFVQMKENLINLDTLELGLHTYEYHVDSAYLKGIEKSELLGGEIDARAELRLREMDYDIRVWARATVQVTCDRCLEPMTITVEAEDDMTADTQDESKNKTKEIDLNWLAYELIVVNLPLVHSHQAGGCNPEMDSLLQDHLCTTEEPEAINE